MRFSPSPIVVVAAALALVGLSFLGYRQFLAAPAPLPPGQVVAVERGTLSSVVSATGTVVSTKTADLAFETSGRLRELHVAVGDSVAAGQPMAALGRDALGIRLEQAQSQLAVAQLGLEQLAQGATPEDVEAAQRAYQSAAARYEELAAGPPAADLRAAEASVASAQATHDQAAARVRALESGGEQAELASAQASLESARSSLASSEARLEELRAGPRSDEIAAAESNLEQAKANLLSAELRLQQTLVGDGELASARSSLASAQSRLHAAHMALSTKDDELAQAHANLQAQRSSLESTRQQAQETCDDVGEGSAECAAARSRIDGIMPNLLAAEARVQRLEGPDSWEMRAAREEVLAAQAAHEAARLKLEEVQETAPANLASLEASVESARASVASAEERLRTVREGPTRADVVAAETGVETARANLASAEARLAALEVSGPQDLETARSSLASATIGLESARARLAQVREGASEADLESARSSIASAQATLAQRTGVDETELALQMESVRQAELSVRQAQLDLEGAALRAPFDGVVSAINGNVGEQVGSGTFLTLVDPTQVRVDVTVDEIDVASIRAGQEARFTFDALPGMVFGGKVMTVAPTGSMTQGVVTYPVTLSIDTRPEPAGFAQDQPPGAGREPVGGSAERSDDGAERAPQALPGGLTAIVEIIIELHEDVLMVPNRAVRREGQQQFVQVLGTDRNPVARQVRTGVFSEQFMEIVEGLEEGDQVVIPVTTTRAPTLGGGGGSTLGGGGAASKGSGGSVGP